MRSKCGEIGAGRPLPAFLGLLLSALIFPPSAFTQLPGVRGSMSDSLAVDRDGDGVPDPGDTLRYTVDIGNATGPEQANIGFEIYLDPNTIFVPGSIRVSPLALDDHYIAVGNIPLGVPAPEGLLANDRDPNDPAMAGVRVTAYDGITSASGTAVVDATGGFTYLPPAGFRGTDSFGYTITDADGFTDSAAVEIAVGGLVWFVDNSAPPDGPGTLLEPFDTLADVELAAATDDVIFILTGDGTSSGLDTGIVLEPGQRLLGQGIDLAIGSEVLVRAATAPVLSATSGAAVTLAPATQVSGLRIDSAHGTGILADGFAGPALISAVTLANHVGDAVRVQNGPDADFVFENVSISTSGGGGVIAGDVRSVTLAASKVSAVNGAAFEIANSGIGIQLGEVSSVNSPGFGIELDNVRGVFLVTTDTDIAGPALTGIRVRNSDGTAFVFGHTRVTGAGDGGVSVTDNPGSLFAFASLTIHADAGTGLRVQNSGTTHIPGNLNRVVALNGTGIHISDTAFGTGGVTFAQVSASGGANGLFLGNTGDWPFTVTGDGASPGSGGTIENTTGDGIHLEGVRDVSLSRMNIFNTGGNGVRGSSVSGFSIAHSQLMNIGDADGEYGIGFDNLWSTGSIANTSMTNVADSNVFVENTSGALDALTIAGGTFTGGAGSAFSGSGVFLRASAGAVIGSVTVADMLFRDMDGAGIDARAGLTSGVSSAVLASFAADRCTVENARAGGVFFLTEGTGVGTFSLRDCPLVEAQNAPALFIGANGSSQTAAAVTGNALSMNRTQDFGYNTVRILSDGEGGSSAATVTLHNNNISGSDAEGIYAQSRDGSGRLDLRITDNAVSSDSADGLFVRSGGGTAGETDTVCLEISGNNSVGAEFYHGIWLYQEGPSTQFLLKGYGGPPADQTAITAFIETGNPPSTAHVLFDVGYGSGDCATPPP